MKKNIRRNASVATAALILVAVGVGVTRLTTGTSHAGSVGHQVTYSITSDIEQYTEIAFIANQPANEMDYADHSQKYLLTVRPKVNPDAPWSYTTTLADPERWAWVSAGDFWAFEDLYVPPDIRQVDHGYHCEIAIDGHVVASNRGKLDVGCGTKPVSHPLSPPADYFNPSLGDLRLENDEQQ